MGGKVLARLYLEAFPDFELEEWKLSAVFLCCSFCAYYQVLMVAFVQSGDVLQKSWFKIGKLEFICDF